MPQAPTDDELPTSEATEILQLTQEAFDLATAACHFDRQENYVGAYDYYDKCILNIDEVMSKLPRTSVQWMDLMQIRIRYDDRMEQIKEMEIMYNQKNSFFNRGGSNTPATESSSTPTTGTPTDDTTVNPKTGLSSKSWKNRARYRLKQQMDVYNFQEMDVFQDFTFSEPPNSPIEVIFWQLKNIQESIEHGGYLTKEIFIPKGVWTQGEVKFSGISNKSHAFETIIKLISTHIDALHLYSDEDSLHLADRAFSMVLEELIALQNQLSKSFGYIRELSALSITSGANKLGLSHTEDELIAFFLTGMGGGSSNETQSEETSGTNSPPVTNPNPSPSPNPSIANPSKQSNKTLSQYMSAFGKNMKKYAEVGLHRLAVALPSKLTIEELGQYTQIIREVCNKVQTVLTWYHFMTGLIGGKKQPQPQLQPAAAAVAAGTKLIENPIMLRNTKTEKPKPKNNNNEEEEENNEEPTITTDGLYSLEQLQTMERIVYTVSVISLIIKELVGEIVLRDVDYLLDRYLHGMRKSYSRMYWDQEYTE